MTIISDKKEDLFEPFNVSEIFYSIQGEGTRTGFPCVFVRFQGCELRCTWCDTPYALDIKQKEKIMSLNDIINSVANYDCKYITLTGGEPLIQINISSLIDALIEKEYLVAIETNGHQNIKNINHKAIIMLDIKAPSSGMSKFNYFDNFNYLKPIDEIKCVVSNRDDYDWLKEIILERNLLNRINALNISPAFGILEMKELAEWILQDNLNARIQLQLHKYIWEPNQRGV